MTTTLTLIPSARNQKGNQKGDQKGGKATQSGKTGRFKSREEATKGVSSNLVDKRMKSDKCARCGQTGHRWFHCANDVVTTSSRGTYVSLILR